MGARIGGSFGGIGESLTGFILATYAKNFSLCASDSGKMPFFNMRRAVRTNRSGQ